MQVNVPPSNLSEEAAVPADLVPSAARPPGRDEVTVAEAGEYLEQYLTRETVCSHHAANMDCSCSTSISRCCVSAVDAAVEDGGTCFSECDNLQDC